MDDDQRTKLAAKLHPGARTEVEKAHAKGFAEATCRVTAVLRSEHFAGREGFAADLLANDKLSADEITGMLARAPKTGTIDEDAAEERARADMRARLAAEQPGLTGIDDGEPEAEANYGWAEAHAEIAKERGL